MNRNRPSSKTTSGRRPTRVFGVFDAKTWPRTKQCLRFSTFMAFLIILCIIAFGMRSRYQHDLTVSVNKAFTHEVFGPEEYLYDEIPSIPEIYQFLKEIALPLLFQKTADQVDPGSLKSKIVLYENYLLGLPRLRQVRMTNTSCKINRDFSSLLDFCFSSYTKGTENTKTFDKKLNGTVWRYHVDVGVPTWGYMAVYDSGGFYVDLGPSHKNSSEQIQYLEENDWLDAGTRAVFVNFALYNANTNLFCIVQLTMEILPSGGVIPTKSIRTLKLIRYETNYELFILVLEFLFIGLCCYYLTEEIVEMKQQKFRYLLSKWNILDLVILIISIICIGFSIYRTIKVNSLIRELIQNPNKHSNEFGYLAFYQVRYDEAVAFLTFFAWIKVFKYISFSVTMAELSKTLSDCTADIAGFCILFFIIFWAFAQLGYLLFGSQVADFKDLTTALLTLVRIILGEVHFSDLERTNRFLGPAYFLIFIILVYFILLNMFLAILTDTYTNVKSQLEAKPEKFHPIAALRKWLGELLLPKRRYKRKSMEPEPEVELQDGGKRMKIPGESVPDDGAHKETLPIDEFVKLTNQVEDIQNELTLVRRYVIKKISF